MIDHEKLLQLAKLRRGHFCFESGHHGDVWLELDAMFATPKAVVPFAREIAGKIRTFKLDAVCGPMTGGARLAEMVASELGVTAYPCERTEAQIESGEVRSIYRLRLEPRDKVAGKRIGIVDDAINAGSAVRETYRELKSAGAEVVLVATLIMLGTAGEKFALDHGVGFETLTCLDSNLWRADECPMCRAGIPISR